MQDYYFITNLMRKNKHQQYDVLDEGWEKQMFNADNDMTRSCNFWLSTSFVYLSFMSEISPEVWKEKTKV